MNMSIKKYFVNIVLCLPMTVNAAPLTVQYLPNTPEVLNTYSLALKGDAKAQLKFAKYYSNLYKKNYRVSKVEFYWYKKAAEQGLPEAQVQVAKLYSETLPFYPNYDEAIKWLLKAADQNYIPAQEDLGWAYLTGWWGEAENYKNST